MYNFGKACLLLSLLIGAPVIAEESDAAPSVEELLKGEPQEDAYTDEPRCIRAHGIREIEVIDEKHVAFQVSRKEYYLVQFEHRCPGMTRDNPVFYEPSGGRLCKHDTIRGSYATGVASFQPGMPCSIPGFQSVSKEQLVLLKDALKAERRKQREERQALKREKRKMREKS